MSLSYSEAPDSFFGLLRSNLSQGFLDNVTLFFQGVGGDVPEKLHGRFFMIHTSSAQRSIGGRLYDKRGIGGIELFETLGNDLRNIQSYANEIKNILQTANDEEFIFTNVTINEAGVYQNKFYQINVTTDFLYFEETT